MFEDVYLDGTGAQAGRVEHGQAYGLSDLEQATHGHPDRDDVRHDRGLSEPEAQILLAARGDDAHLQRRVGKEFTTGLEASHLTVEREGEILHDERGAQLHARARHCGPRLPERGQLEIHEVLEFEPVGHRVEAGGRLPHGAIAHRQRVEVDPRSQRQGRLREAGELGLEVLVTRLPADHADPDEDDGRSHDSSAHSTHSLTIESSQGHGGPW